jgi:hypothetical protein
MAEPSTYDPQGEAGIWEEASRLIVSLKRSETIPGDEHDFWNAALTMASRELEKRGREIRQANGMYYRVLDGNRDEA